MGHISDIPYEKSGLIVVFDYETSGLHADDGARPSTLGVKWGPTKAEQCLVPYDQGMLNKPGTQPVLFGDAPNVGIRQWNDVHEWLQKQHLVAHQAKADLWFAWAGLREFPNERWDLSAAYHWDTLVVEALLIPGLRVGLDLISRRMGWNEPYEKTDLAMREWTKKHKIGGIVRYDLAPWDILAPYLAGDLERTWMLYWSQRERLQEGEIPPDLLYREIEMVRTLFRMEQRGLPYQVKESLAAAAKAMAEMEELDRAMPFDPSTKADVVKWFVGQGMRVEANEDKTQLDQATVTRAIELGIAGAAEYQQWAKLRTARGLWYYGWATKAGADGRVRAEYRQIKMFEGNNSNGTVSGRLAVSRVQVQAIPGARQIPKGYPTMQHLIRPDGEYRLYEIDLSQAEMRVAASIAGCTGMLEGFANGMDAHDSTTRLIWGIEKSAEEWDDRRQVAKRLGFGVIYGAGVTTLAQQILLFTGEDLGEDGVRELWDQYKRAFPELFRYSRNVQRFVERKKWVMLPGGKIRIFGPLDFAHKAFNAVIQGGVASAMTEAMNQIEKNYPGVMVGQVHDSVMVETDDEYTPEGVAEVISSVFERWFPGCEFPTNVKDYASK